jgi:hypothetical protein
MAMPSVVAKGLYLVVVAALVIMVIALTAAVVRLENYRYANFVGFCTDYDMHEPRERIRREKCLETSETRTHWFWHVLYGVRLL